MNLPVIFQGNVRFRKPAALSVIRLSAILICLCAHPARAQQHGGKDPKQLNLRDLPALKFFVPTVTDMPNRKAETFWYKGSAGYTSHRLLYGFSEVNYTVLKFSSRQAMRDWDARFARLGIRSDWRTGEVFKNAGAIKPTMVSELPWPTGLIALHVDFSVGNQVILVGGNQHKGQFRVGPLSRSRGLSDPQLTRTVHAVAQELKRRVSSSKAATPPKMKPRRPRNGISVSLDF